MPKQPIKNAESYDKMPMFAQGSGKDVIEAYGRGLYKANALSTYNNIAPNNVSIRDGYDKQDYDYFRPGERTPRTQLEIVTAAMQAYERVGIVRNIIDMMGDFVAQGVDIVHPRPSIEKWFKAWGRKVNIKERTERFANMLYRAGTAVIQRHTAKIDVQDEQALLRGMAKPDYELNDPIKLVSREIPIHYTLHNPLQIEVLGGDLAIFAGPSGFSYGIRIPEAVYRKIKFPKSEIEKKLISELPKSIRQSILDGIKIIPLNSDKVVALYYKRDDWSVWATPMTTAILSDLKIYKKLQLADISALDGAISNIRLWSLGSLENNLFPTEKALNILANVLTNNVGGGVIDLMWGPDLKLTQTKSDVYKFLGIEKYAPTLQAIYGGLGIPPTLTGASQSGGFTNNFISLRTLTERLEYVRDIIARFWETELSLVQKSMGFRDPARVVFDRSVLTDEAAEKQLLINLVDRDIISAESVLEHFDKIPEIENIRISREQASRKAETMPEKAGPFHKTQIKEDIKKMFVQQGVVAPSEVGIDLQTKTDGEKIPMEHQADLNAKDNEGKQKVAKIKSKKNKGQPGQGRPRNSNDKSKRKTKKVKPRTSASAMNIVENFHWAEEAQRTIAEITHRPFLDSVGKNNLRKLTNEEFEEYETFKFHLLCNLPAGETVDKQIVAKVIDSELPVAKSAIALYERCISQYTEKHGQVPTIEVKRLMQCEIYSLVYTKGEHDGED